MLEIRHNAAVDPTKQILIQELQLIDLSKQSKKVISLPDLAKKHRRNH